MQSFWYLFTSKAAVCERDIIRLNKVLSTLTKTRQDAEQMRDYIEQLKQRWAESEKETAFLLEEIVCKSMVLEKLRAKFALPHSLPGYIHREDKDEYVLPEEERRLLLDGNHRSADEGKHLSRRAFQIRQTNTKRISNE